MMDDHVNLYKSLFQGRNDVYARRWEKNTKSGWSPAYSFNWDEFNKHRAHGGTIKDFEHKSLVPFTDTVVKNHIQGRETVGVYPIFQIIDLSPFNSPQTEIKDKFGVIIIDECHHIPAKTYRQIIRSFKSEYCYGLTATHERKYGQHIVAELCIGPVIAEMKTSLPTELKKFNIQVIPSCLELPFRYKNDHYEILAKTIAYDTGRNKLVSDAILDHLKKDHKILVLTERKEHIEILALHLRDVAEIITLSGDDSARQKKLKLDQIISGNFKVLIATGQLLGEGLDIIGFDVLVLSFPISFEGKLNQYIGRLRGNGVKYVADIRDPKVDFLERQFKKRKKLYEKEFDLNPSVSNN